MKWIMEFTEEDKRSYEVYSRGMDWALVVWDIDNYLHGRLNGDYPEDVSKAYENVRDHLIDLLCSYGLSLESIE